MPAMRQVPDAALPGARALNLPGLALIAASRSLTVLYGASARTWRPAGSALTRPSGVYDAPRELGQALPVHHADLDRDQADRVAVGRAPWRSPRGRPRRCRRCG